MRDRSPKKLLPIDPRQARTYPLRRRRSKVRWDKLARTPRRGMSLAEFLNGLPDVLAAADLRRIARELARRHRAGRLLVLGMGAHPIKVGLSPLIIDLMRRGVLDAVAMNGAGIIHDFEMAYHGATSEEVGPALLRGEFGMAEETGAFLNSAVARAGELGLGAAVGKAMAAASLRHPELSILVAGERFGVPVTVHVAIGTDIIHMHPTADGAAIGRASLTDFHRLAGVVRSMHGGAYINLGSAVILPEVFVKALNLARNLGGRVGRLLTVDIDFLRHYRPLVNVVQRPTEPDGLGFRLTGHHEILFPLLCAALVEELEGSGGVRAGRRP